MQSSSASSMYACDAWRHHLCMHVTRGYSFALLTKDSGARVSNSIPGSLGLGFCSFMPVVNEQPRTRIFQQCILGRRPAASTPVINSVLRSSWHRYTSEVGKTGPVLIPEVDLSMSEARLQTAHDLLHFLLRQLSCCAHPVI